MFLSREKVRKNKIFENNELKLGKPPGDVVYYFTILNTNKVVESIESIES